MKERFREIWTRHLNDCSAEHGERWLALVAGLHVCAKKLSKATGNTRRMLIHMILACAMYLCLK